MNEKTQNSSYLDKVLLPYFLVMPLLCHDSLLDYTIKCFITAAIAVVGDVVTNKASQYRQRIISKQ